MEEKKSIEAQKESFKLRIQELQEYEGINLDKIRCARRKGAVWIRQKTLEINKILLNILEPGSVSVIGVEKYEDYN